MRVSKVQICCIPSRRRNTEWTLSEKRAEEKAGPRGPRRHVSRLLRNEDRKATSDLGRAGSARAGVKRDPARRCDSQRGLAAAATLALFARSCSRCSMYWSMTYMSFTGTASVSGLKPATFPKRKRSVFRSYWKKYTVKKMCEAFGSY